MRASTIITICGTLNKRIAELKARKEAANKAYHAQQEQLYRDAAKGKLGELSDDELFALTQELQSRKDFESYCEQLHDLESALWDFEEHDFH